MHGNELPLQVRRQLSDLDAVFGKRALNFVAIGLALGGALEIEQPRVPRRNLDTDIAEAGSPLGDIAKRVERRFIAGELSKEDSRALDRFHSVAPCIRCRTAWRAFSLSASGE